jgi:hypothetical protein
MPAMGIELRTKSSEKHPNYKHQKISRLSRPPRNGRHWRHH